MSGNPQKSILLLRFLRTFYNSMSWGCRRLLKSKSGVNVVSNRWKSIISLHPPWIQRHLNLKILKRYFQLSRILDVQSNIRLSTILVIIFWNFTMFQYRSDSAQVKRNVISSIKILVYELPHDLLNDLTLRILGNKEILVKSQIWVETQPSVQSPFQKLNFGDSNQKTRKSRYKAFLFLSSFIGFLYLSQIFCPGVFEQTTFWS